MEENANIISLLDDEGNEVTVEVLGVEEYEGKEYVVILPNASEEERVDVLLIEESNDEFESYAMVDTDVAMAVFEQFKENHKDEYEFVD